MTTRRDFLQLSLAAAALAAGELTPALARTRPRGSAPLKILILGGTGFIGPHIVQAARARGHTLTLFNRGKTRPGLFPGIETLNGDRDPDKDEGIKALAGRSWDVVIDDTGYVPRIVKASSELLAKNVERYIFVSTMSVYASNAEPDMDEDAPVITLADPTTENVRASYGGLKALCEKAAQTAIPDRVCVVRPGLIVGPGDNTDRFTYWPVRIARGGEVLAPGTPHDPVQFVDVRDLARFLVALAENKTVGTFNALGPLGGLPIHEMLEGCKAAAKSDATFTWVDADFLQEHKVTPWSDMPVWIPPRGEYAGIGRRSCARSMKAGLTFRPVEETARDTLAWWKTLPPEKTADERAAKLAAGLSPSRESEVLAAWHAKHG